MKLLMCGWFVVLAACGHVADNPDAALDAPRMDAPDAADAPIDADPFLIDMLFDFDASKDLMLNANSKVVAWKDQSGKHNDASAPASPTPTAVSANVTFNGATRTIVRFDGNSFLTVMPHVPPAGTLFLLYSATASSRVVGWENYATGTNGLGIETGAGTQPMYVIARRSNASGDISAASPATTFELDVVSWGSLGVTLERYKPGVATEAKANGGLTSVGDDGFAFHIGSSGDANAKFHGDIMRLRAYGKQLSDPERAAIASALMMP